MLISIFQAGLGIVNCISCERANAKCNKWVRFGSQFICLSAFKAKEHESDTHETTTEQQSIDDILPIFGSTEEQVTSSSNDPLLEIYGDDTGKIMFYKPPHIITLKWILMLGLGIFWDLEIDIPRCEDNAADVALLEEEIFGDGDNRIATDEKDRDTGLVANSTNSSQDEDVDGENTTKIAGESYHSSEEVTVVAQPLIDGNRSNSKNSSSAVDYRELNQ